VDSVPVAGLSMFDRVVLGMDEDGHRVEVELVYRKEMDGRYRWLRRQRRRKVVASDPVELIVAVVDEVAYYSATVGRKQEQEEFSRLLRDVVARGRAAGVIVVAATQRPSVDIIPTSLRDLFGYRLAFRCTTDVSSDIILGHGWAKENYDASKIAPKDLGVGWLRAEGGLPVRMKSAFLSDEQIYDLVDYAGWLRTSHKRDEDRHDGGSGAAS
jgi:S-DNA-T family DNA segregation ATPase FtsK/SpoIIIE